MLVCMTHNLRGTDSISILPRKGQVLGLIKLVKHVAYQLHDLQIKEISLTNKLKLFS
jgi:hypothetical protein